METASRRSTATPVVVTPVAINRRKSIATPGAKIATPQTAMVKTPKAETPKAETPKVKTPKTKTPKAETPKTKTPKLDTPKSKTPKVKTPKVDTPKVLKSKTPKSVKKSIVVAKKTLYSTVLKRGYAKPPKKIAPKKPT